MKGSRIIQSLAILVAVWSLYEFVTTLMHFNGPSQSLGVRAFWLPVLLLIISFQIWRLGRSIKI